MCPQFHWAQPNARFGGYGRDPGYGELYPIGNIHIYPYVKMHASLIPLWFILRRTNVGLCDEV